METTNYKTVITTRNFVTAVGILLMSASVPLLYFGLVGPSISYTFSMKVYGQDYSVLDKTRSLLGEEGLVQWLWKNNSRAGAAFLVLFGVVLPFAKYCAFIFWLSGIGSRATANWAVSAFQRISKWAAVDAIFSAIFVGMLLKIPAAQAHHGPAYLSFILYCVSSTMAFACLPGEVQADDPNPTPLTLAVASKLTSPSIRAGVLSVSLAAFLTLLTLAGGAHSVRLWVPDHVIKDGVDDLLQKFEKANNDKLTQQGVPAAWQPHLTPAQRDQIRAALGELPKIDSKVSVSGCIHRLLLSTHKYTIYGSVVLFFCVVFFPVIYAVLTAAKALSMTEWNEFQSIRDPLNSIPENESVKGESPWEGLDKFRAFARDLSMLDVLAVGIFGGYIITQDENALSTGLEPGYAFLVLAAITWHVHNFLCSCIQASAVAAYHKAEEHKETFEPHKFEKETFEHHKFEELEEPEPAPGASTGDTGGEPDL